MKIRRNKMIDVTTVLLSCCLCVAPMLQAVDTAATSGAAVANSLLLPPGNACTLQQPSTQPQLVYLVPSQPAPQPAQPTVQSGRGFFSELFLRHPLLCISTVTATVGTGAYLIRSAIHKRRMETEQARLAREQTEQRDILREVQRSQNQTSTDISALNTGVNEVRTQVTAVQAEQARQAEALAAQTEAVGSLRQEVITGFTSTNVEVAGLRSQFGTFTAEQRAAFEKREQEEREAREKHSAHMEQLFQEAQRGNATALRQFSEEMAINAAVANSRLEALEQGQAAQRQEFQAGLADVKGELATLSQNASRCADTITRALRRPNQVFILNNKQKTSHPRVKEEKSKTHRPRITWKSLNQVD